MGLTLQSMLCSHEFSPTLVVAIRLNTVSLEPVHEINKMIKIEVLIFDRICWKEKGNNMLRGGHLLKQIACHLKLCLHCHELVYDYALGSRLLH